MQGSDGFCPATSLRLMTVATNVVKERRTDNQQGDTLPVFRSESGDAHDLARAASCWCSTPEWSQAETNVSSFFSNNAIKLDRVSELELRHQRLLC